jgi:hypothetical protein
VAVLAAAFRPASFLAGRINGKQAQRCLHR